jgi:outer membrane protein assembly factor BamE
MRFLFIALAIISLGACTFVGFPGVYKIDVEQGNIVKREDLDQLKPGMSRRQVRFILGTPLVEDTFNQDRWVYLYVKRNGQDVLNESQLNVNFEGDSLKTLSGDFLPEGWDTGEEPASEDSPAQDLEGSEASSEETETQNAG